MSHTSTVRRRRTSAISALAALLVSLSPSCKLTKAVVSAPVNMTEDMMGKEKPPEPPPPAVVQAAVMRYADTFSAELVKATEEFSRKVGTPEARMQGLTWAIRHSTAAYTIATGKSGNSNLLDMLVLVTLGRSAHDTYWMPEVWHEADQPMVDAYHQLEEDAWVVAGQYLTPKQIEVVRETLNEWVAKNPQAGASMFVRLPAFQELLAAKGKDPGMLSGLGEMISIDPLSGLEPMTREVEQARQLAERSVYYMQRAQLVLPMQVELLLLETMRMPDTQSVLADSQRVSKAAESIANTAANLPETLPKMLQQSEEPVGKLLTQAEATLTAGGHMSDSLTGMVATVDKFMGRFDKKEGESEPVAPPPPTEPAVPAKPFDIAEYGAVCEKLGAAARDLNGLVSQLDQNMPQVQTLVGEVIVRGNETIDHVYMRGLTLGATLIAITAVALLCVRWITRRWIGPAR
jgi:hypothetical protein